MKRQATWLLELSLVAAGLAGVALFVLLFDRAFPVAALDLKLSRGEVMARAEAYMAQQGYDLDGYRHSLTFQQAGLQSVYLERTLGVAEANSLARDQALPLWYWHVRWFRPFEKQEFRLELLPDGQVVGLYRTLPENAPGASLPQAEAQALAETYLTADRGWSLADWERVAASSEAQPGGRTDHYFEWKRRHWQVGASELKVAVDVQGERVDGYDYWLDLPEAFEREFSGQRNRANFINNISYYLGAAAFGVTALFFFFRGHRQGVFPWHEGLPAGLAVAAVVLLARLNWLPLAPAFYDTTQSYAVFWAYRVGDALLSAGYTAVEVALLWAGGRALARRVWPQQDRVLPRGAPGGDDDRWVALGRAAWHGLLFGGVAGGYVVLFYLAAARLVGGWVPMTTPDVNLYATPLPFLAALSSGVGAAISEETMFRLIGVGLLLALTRRRWLALLVPGVIWAFAHLWYVRDPIWLRGAELTVMALLWGWTFLRYGLATSIVAHLAFNAGLTALPLLRSGEPYFVANGALVVVLLLAPAVVAAVRMWQRRGIAARPEPEMRPLALGDRSALEGLKLPGVDWAALLADPAATTVGLWSGERLIGAAAARGRQVLALYIAPDWRRRYWGSRLALALSTAAAASTGPGSPPALQAAVQTGQWALARFWDALGWRPAATSYAAPPGGLAAQPIWREWLPRRDHG